MDPVVFPQVPSLREHLPTGGAAERLLPSVDPLVDLHLLGPVKGLSTIAAHKQSLFGAGWMMQSGTIGSLLGEAEAKSATSPAINTGGWKISRDHGIQTRRSPSLRDGPGLLVKLLSERVIWSFINKRIKIRASASVFSELLRICGFLLGATHFTLKMRGGVTDLHSSAAAAAAVLLAPAPSPGQALGLAGAGLAVLISQDGSCSSKRDAVHHTFTHTEND